jgi:hypothetical protein
MAAIINASRRGIIWDFSVTEQGHVARYGHMGSDYYKQFMPYGLELKDRHPPLRIDRLVYDLAERKFMRPLQPLS